MFDEIRLIKRLTVKGSKEEATGGKKLKKAGMQLKKHANNHRHRRRTRTLED